MLNTRKLNLIIEAFLIKEFNFQKNKNIILDKNNNIINIKVSRVLEKNCCINYNLAEYCINNSLLERIMTTEEISYKTFDCNIQQIKMKSDSDILYYCLLFKNCIQVFKINYQSINILQGFCGKQHKGNLDECQFHISNSNYNFHLKNLIRTFSYEELYNILLTMEG